MQQPQGGGFWAGAAQTAMGVTGSLLLANAVGSMFAGDAAAPQKTPLEPVKDQLEEAGYEEGDSWEETL